jgi:hypothetical protein
VMKSQLNGLKPLQLTELETEFGSLEGVGRARAERSVICVLISGLLSMLLAQ